MPNERIVNVSSIVDNQPVTRITILVFVLCFLAMISDGYDLGVVGIAAPGIVKNFNVARSEMAPIFSAALFGMLIGAFICGTLSDRFGRRFGILTACLTISVASFFCAATSSFSNLLWFRFFVGLGIGGLIPNVTALVAEFAPKRVRGAFTTFANLGIGAGGIFPGVISSQIVGGNWRELFFVGGMSPLVVLPVIYIFLPESLKFLALQAHRKEELRRLLKRISPETNIPLDAEFILDEVKVKKFALASLFNDGLKFLTPLLWITFISITLVNFFINSWLTLVLRDVGFSSGQAASTASLYYLGGVCGGLLMGPALDYIGPMTLVLFSLLGCLISVLIGISLPHSTHMVMHVLVFLVGFGVIGTQVGMSATAGLIYPTAIRAQGAGFANSIGRFGSISGPLLAGLLIAQHATLFILFLVPVVPLSIAACSFFLITGLWTGKTFGFGLINIKNSLKTSVDEISQLEIS
jgi:AAHS family 4-hydroxybenzoate transporter-like MFS transporter